MASNAGGTLLTGASSGEYISVAGLRVDGRRREEVRRIRTRMGLFQRVDGSAYYEQGNTKVVAVVYGPRELKQAAAASSSGAGAVGTGSGNAASNTQPRAVVQCEFTQAPFATSERKAARSGDRKKLESSLAIKQIFEACIQTQLYPRSQIDIFVQVLHADGGEMPASINAITLALIDAGIAVNDFVVASSAGYLQQTMLCGASFGSGACCVNVEPRKPNSLSLSPLPTPRSQLLRGVCTRTATGDCAEPAHAEAEPAADGVQAASGALRGAHGRGHGRL